jgi:hypothetical protein
MIKTYGLNGCKDEERSVHNKEMGRGLSIIKRWGEVCL